MSFIKSLSLSLIIYFILLNLCIGKRVRKDLELDCVPEAETEDPEGISLFEEDTYKITGLSNQEGTRITIADDFDVVYASTFKIVDNFKVNETYVLYSCGTEKPNLKELDLKHAKLFEIPLTSVSLYDGTSAGFMNLLNISDRVTYTSEYAVDSCYQKIRKNCGRISLDPGDGYADPDLLKEQNKNVDAIFHYSSSNDKKTIAFTATMDPSVLNRVEWIKFLSVFFNKEVEANSIFDKILKDWDTLKGTITKKRKKPLVAWINYQDFDTKEFIINNDTYKMDYIKGAGGKTLKIKDLLKINGIEEVYDGAAIKIKDDFSKAAKTLGKAIKDVDIIIDETYAPRPNKYTLKSFFDNYGITDEDEYKFLSNSKIYRLDGLMSKGEYSDSLDWFENAVARPDLVLKDFLEAFGTSKKHDDHERIWLRNIALGEKAKKIKAKHCNNFKDICDIVPEVICPSVVLSCSNTLVLRDPLNNTCLPLKC